MSSILDRDRIVAGAGYSRWLVPPAALAIHLCIGQVYGFSVFNLPLTKVIGITKSAPDDWKLTSMALMTLSMLLLLPYFAFVFDFLNPLNIVARIR